MRRMYKYLLVVLSLLMMLVSPVNVRAATATTTVILGIKDLTTAAKEDLAEKLNEQTDGDMTYNEFIKAIDDSKVTKVYMEYEDYLYCFTVDGCMYKVPNPGSDSIKEKLLVNEITIMTVTDIAEHLGIKDIDKQTIRRQSSFSAGEWALLIFIMIALPALLRVGMVHFIQKEENKVIAGQKAKEKAEQEEMKAHAKKFDDIAGLKEVKEDMKTLVDFLVNGDKYREMGAELPRGVLLYGPSGTGKTLLARAVAGEAGVPFFHMSGSDFTEKYVGVGAKRIREFFEKGRKNAPCILFIDEIDAIACKRGNDNENGEDRKTLNALLTAMDGFDDAGDVLVIGATNRLEDIDDAIIRPGRFTNKYCVPLPESFEDRYAIIQIYAKNKKFMEDVDLKHLAKMTIGCSPAEIESILNESAIVATKNGLCAIDNDSLEEAFNKQIFKGHVKKDTFNRRKKELELVAWHGAGHAIAGLLLGEDVYKVTILSSTTGAGGATFTIPKKMGLHSVEDLKIQVIGLYAGRCAELLYFKGDREKVTTGASNDIERASAHIKQMVKFLGMNQNIGLLNLNVLGINDKIVLDEASKVAKAMEETCLAILKDNYDLLEKLATDLLEHETIYEDGLKFVEKRISLSDFIKAA